MSIDRDATLVVTRPQEDAARLIDALVARGRRVVALPVLAIEAVDDPAPLTRTMGRLSDYRLVVFVSPNAIRRALARATAPWPRDTTIGVMGPGSVDALARLGIAAPAYRVIAPDAEAADLQGPRFDSESLFAVLDRTLGLTRGFDGRALIVRGNGGRAWFADRLRALDIAVDEVEAYRRVCPAADDTATARLVELFATRAPVVFVVTSSEGIGNLLAIVDRALAGTASSDAVRTWLLDAPILAPHQRIAERAREVGFTRLTVCGPGDSGVIAAIE